MTGTLRNRVDVAVLFYKMTPSLVLYVVSIIYLGKQSYVIYVHILYDPLASQN